MAAMATTFPVRHPMTLGPGGWAILAGGAAGAGGQDSLKLAIIAGGCVVAASVLGPLVTAVAEWLRQRNRRPPVDHHVESSFEQEQLFAHLLGELRERDEENAKLRAKVARLEARRRA